MQFQSRALQILVLASFCAAAPAAWGAKVHVDWAKPTGAKGASAKYGLNLFKVYNPAVSQQNPAYKRELSRMAPGYIRVHSWNMMGNSAAGDGWIADGDKATYRWDEAKIIAALKGVIPTSAKGMMNIPAWPAFLGESEKPLPQANTAAFAAFCAQLVQIVNIKGKYGVKYWEVTNERDDVYNGQGAALAKLIIEAARAMKKVDPTILVGGPAFIQPWHPIVGDFLAASVSELDFISYHTYATGDANAPLQGLFDHAGGLGGIATYVRGEIAKHTQRKLEIFHNEYNISYAPPDARMSSMDGAVFDALALVGFANADISGSAAWNEADGWYGKLDGDMKPKPASFVFELFNRLALGEVVTSTSDAPKTLVPLAIGGASGKSLFLINRTAAPIAVDVTGFDDRKPQASQVTKDGLAQVAVPTTGQVTLPALSVTVVVAGSGASGSGGQGGNAGAGGASGVGGASGSGGAAGASGSGGVQGSGGTGGSGGFGANANGGANGGATSGGRGGRNAGGDTEAQAEGGSGGETDEPSEQRASTGCSIAQRTNAGIVWALLPALLWGSLRRRRRPHG